VVGGGGGIVAKSGVLFHHNTLILKNFNIPKRKLQRLWRPDIQINCWKCFEDRTTLNRFGNIKSVASDSSSVPTSWHDSLHRAKESYVSSFHKKCISKQVLQVSKGLDTCLDEHAMWVTSHSNKKPIFRSDSRNSPDSVICTDLIGFTSISQ